MEGEERAHRDAHFQEELESLKASVARLTSLLEQTLRNASGEGPSNRPAIFVRPPTKAQPEETMSEHGQEPPYNPAFVHSTPPTPAPAVIYPPLHILHSWIKRWSLCLPTRLKTYTTSM